MQNSLKLSFIGILLFVSFGDVLLQNIEPILLVHGGAGDVSDASVPGKHNGAKLAALIGYDTLKITGNVVDAVQNAVRSMELDENFNAGYGAALTWDATVEMDAVIMDGADLNAGCVSIAQNIAHPIELARRIMDRSRHVYLAGEGLMKFAADQGFDFLPEGALVTNRSLKALEDYKNSLNPTAIVNGKFEFPQSFGEPGTVGAVAIDAYGNVAVATSTGGITGKLPGRIGDSPILGGGSYADNVSGAISATGHGETIMRYNVASRILALIEGFGMSAQEASEKVLNDMTNRFNETAGVVTIDRLGSLGIYFTSRRMSWAYQKGNELHYGIDKGEDNIEILPEPKIDFY